MSVSMWSYRPEVCDGGGCPGDCDLCDKPKNMEDEDDEEQLDEYMEREYPDLINNEKARKEIRNTLGFSVFSATRSIEKLMADIEKTTLGKFVLRFGGHKHD